MGRAAPYLRLFACSALAVGCTLGSGDDVDDARTESAAVEESYVSEAVHAALRARHSDFEGRTWEASSGDLSEGWLLQTPPGEFWGRADAMPVAEECRADEPGCDPDFLVPRCDEGACAHGECRVMRATITRDDEAPRALCVGAADRILDPIYDVAVSATSTLDIATLDFMIVGGAISGRFLATLRNAVTRLSLRASPPLVRVVYGAPPTPGGTNASELSAQLARDVSPTSPIRIAVAAQRRRLLAWNHSKMIAADGRRVITGGMNLWGSHYLGTDPVHDLSVRVEGPVAASAHHLADELWRGVCDNPGGSSWAAARGVTLSTDGCPYATLLSSASKALPVFGVGRLGATVADGDDASDDALLAMVRSARQRIHLSQQDLLGSATPKLWEAFIDELGDAMGRGVDVEVLLSAPGARPNGERMSGYSNGTAEETLRLVYERVGERACGHLHVATLGGTWPSGFPLASHAKLVVIDAQAFYVGTQNLYPTPPAKLAEYGLIIDSPAATRQLLDDYWRPAFATTERVLTACAAK